MRHNAGAHADFYKIDNPVTAKWAIIISTLIIAGVFFTAAMIAIFVA